MNDHYAIIKAAIITKLQTLTKPKYIYAYEKGELEGYPAITVYSAEYNPVPLTTAHDLDTYIFTLHIYQEQQSDNTTAEEAETITNQVVTEVVQAFQQDQQLGNVCDSIGIATQMGWTDRELINRAAVITLTVIKAVQVE